MASLPTHDGQAAPSLGLVGQLSEDSSGIAILPERLADRAAYYQVRLAAEIQPRNTLQTILVNELARHAAGMELGSTSEAATLKYAVQNSAAVELFAGVDPDAVGLVAAMGSELVMRTARCRAQHERAFFSALRQLRDVASAPAALLRLSLFGDEGECAHYLRCWQEQQSWSAPTAAVATDVGCAHELVLSAAAGVSSRYVMAPLLLARICR